MDTNLRVVARFQAKVAAIRWDGKLLGRDARLRWSKDVWLLEELPQKGKKKLKVADLDNPGGRGWDRFGAYIPGNILRSAKIGSSDGYEGIKKKILDAYMEAAEITINSMPPKQVEQGKGWGWLRETKWSEREVFYLNVEPEGTEPFKVEGKDFTVQVEWAEFTTYSPDSDFQQADPHYTVYNATSPTAARKFYMILKADPTALKSVSWKELSKWFDKNRVGYETHFSQWHQGSV